MVEQLKLRARQNHRSLQGEVLAILEAAVRTSPRLGIGEVYERVQRLGLRTPSESAAIIRADRDSNHGIRVDRDDDHGH